MAEQSTGLPVLPTCCLAGKEGRRSRRARRRRQLRCERAAKKERLGCKTAPNPETRTRKDNNKKKTWKSVKIGWRDENCCGYRLVGTRTDTWSLGYHLVLTVSGQKLPIGQCRLLYFLLTFCDDLTVVKQLKLLSKNRPCWWKLPIYMQNVILKFSDISLTEFKCVRLLKSPYEEYCILYVAKLVIWAWFNF